MGFKQGLKNFVGDLVGYSRCPVTGDTFMASDRIAVPYSSHDSQLILEMALRSYSPTEITRKILGSIHSSQPERATFSANAIIDILRQGEYEQRPEPLLKS